MVSTAGQTTEPNSASTANHEVSTRLEHRLCSQYEEKVRPCIDLVDSLRALGVEQDLALPAIAVIGDQSSGKSSVLEALSGVALPRGSGIVTRCPLVLKLRKLRNEDEWRGKISYKDIEINLSAPSEVEKEISKCQNIIAGEGMGISPELISLEVSSPHVPDLTLIDLPGITRVAVGNQPADIGYQIRRLIEKYIIKEETINLVVVPCNVDITTTEALSMAQEVDPEGDRTIGILTKPDLVDKGTEDKIVDVARNLIYHLKKGYMIVKCRGQQDIQNQLSLSEALFKERAFFKDHPYFRDLLEEGRATVPCLAEKLTTELIEHIAKSLPRLESQIKEKQQEVAEQLQKYGVDIPEDESGKMLFLIDKINMFNEDICTVIGGEEFVGENDIRLFNKIRNEFCKWSQQVQSDFNKGYQNVLRKMQQFENQYRGRELPGFVNYKTFETLVRQQIQTLEEPAVHVLTTVTEMVVHAFTNVSKRHYEEFFNLFKICKSKIEDIKVEQEKEAEKSIRLHFQMEQIVYCQDHEYQTWLNAVREKELKKKNSGTMNPQNDSPTSFLDEILQYLMAYHKEARKRLSSQIPLIIQFFILRSYGQKLNKAMLQLLQDKEKYDFLLKERSDTSDKRKFLKEQLSRLTKARRQLCKFPG
ncbi:interferon-induced GTP-binding protein Mx1 isoform X2 [Pteronotus mesoamericanus]|uniref:interferon-induced GTP-binding protein Mx1 isoform X2 n=1 Tax=Pteronotus mesoamericanus TaxID=1884717 RepID=UPI0023ED6C10|nr:interferon-induced GTP-binding protein Mx1 isoform X2 [Pteronotus parnellii mesoamericanus]